MGAWWVPGEPSAVVARICERRCRTWAARAAVNRRSRDGHYAAGSHPAHLPAYRRHCHPGGCAHGARGDGRARCRRLGRGRRIRAGHVDSAGSRAGSARRTPMGTGRQRHAGPADHGRRGDRPGRRLAGPTRAGAGADRAGCRGVAARRGRRSGRPPHRHHIAARRPVRHGGRLRARARAQRLRRRHVGLVGVGDRRLPLHLRGDELGRTLAAGIAAAAPVPEGRRRDAGRRAGRREHRPDSEVVGRRVRRSLAGVPHLVVRHRLAVALEAAGVGAPPRTGRAHPRRAPSRNGFGGLVLPLRHAIHVAGVRLVG